MSKEYLTQEKINSIYQLIDQGKVDEIEWATLSDSYILPVSFVREFREYLDWVYITACHKHTLNFIREFADEIYQGELNRKYHNLPFEFLEELKDRTEDFGVFLSNVHLKEDQLEYVLEKYSELINSCEWTNITMSCNLSEEFMQKYAEHLDWSYIIFKQDLSIPFIERHLDMFNFMSICGQQKIDIDFIEKHKDQFNYYCWRNLFDNKKINKSVKDNYKYMRKLVYSTIKQARQLCGIN